MILDYITDYKLNFDEMKLAKDLHTRPFPYGTKLKNIYNFFKKNENKYHYKTIASIDLVNQKNIVLTVLKILKNSLLLT